MHPGYNLPKIFPNWFIASGLAEVKDSWFLLLRLLHSSRVFSKGFPEPQHCCLGLSLFMSTIAAIHKTLLPLAACSGV